MGEQCEAETPAEMLERESCVFLCLKVQLNWRFCGTHIYTHLCAPMYIHTLHLVSIIKIGAGCQLCHSPLLLTGNARGAGQTGHAKYKVGALAIQDRPTVFFKQNG